MLRCTEYKDCKNKRNCKHSGPHEHNSRCTTSCTIGEKDAGACVDDMKKTGKLIRLNVGEKSITLWRKGKQELKFHNEPICELICEPIREFTYDPGLVTGMRTDRMKKRRAAFRASMRRYELFVLAIWAAIIGFAAVSSF